MKLEIEGEHGFKFTAENPDESLKLHWCQKMRDALNNEIDMFLEETRVALRKLAPGETVIVQSRPIVVTLSRVEEPSPAAGGET